MAESTGNNLSQDFKICFLDRNKFLKYALYPMLVIENKQWDHMKRTLIFAILWYEEKL